MGEALSRAGDAVPNVPGVFAPEPLYCGDDSVLYRARRDPGGTPVVVKFPRARGPRAERDEIELWRMHSSNRGVHSLLQHGTADDGRPYAVMEDCPDGDYRRILAEQGPVAVDEAVAAGTAVAEALAAMHARGLLHHAVAPENVLRARFGPALIDFGSALPRDHPFPPVHHRDGAVEHVPPEQSAGAFPEPASDVYRLASTVWTLLAGRPPCAGGTGDDPGETEGAAPADSSRAGAPACWPPRVPRDDVPERIQDALRRALAPDPAERVGDAAAFASLLRGGDTAEHAEPTPPPLRTPRRPGPRPDRPPPGAAPEAESPGRRLQRTEADTGLGTQPPPKRPAEPERATAEGSFDGGAHRREGPRGSGLPSPEPLPPPAPAAEAAPPPVPDPSPGPAPDPAPAPVPLRTPRERPARTDAEPIRSTAAGAPDPGASGAEAAARHSGSGAGSTGRHAAAEPSRDAADAAVAGLDAVPEPPYALDPAVTPAAPWAAPPHALDAGTAAASGGPYAGVPPWRPHPPIGPPDAPPAGVPPLDALHPPFPGARPRRRAGRVALYALAASALLVVVGAVAWTSAPLLRAAPASSGQPPAAAGASREPSAPPGGDGPPPADGAAAGDAAEDAAQDATDGAGQSGGATGPAAVAPTGVEIRDGTISVTLSWTDSTGGAATHHVVGGPVGAGEDAGMASVSAGETSVEITGLNPDVEYCFRVVAVQSIDLSAASQEVCTDRASRG
ncbi:protein kinase domain-containing protein [Streptomonospora wellingtoniae]|uniref:non-specific serine/threonine protein kinase n=1 Tax=Streptomonospora wellingtoniae TaxID=3075544 RepID=A0ABU2KN97_9ACTN|nr:fibronectin type III domain-containing protein [Streptomonospora sp. DSM 45055]MDT0300744.1 fibronectin type III domain-containing protein [Streptomonospora sp. DSM 45055]